MIKNIKKLYKQYDHFVFDLDNTIWTCKDKNDYSIYAKQLLVPFKLYEYPPLTGQWDYVEDDVFNDCTLHSRIREYLDFLESMDKKISYVSIGKRYEHDSSFTSLSQPSKRLLSLFDLNAYFDNGDNVLVYKDE